MSGWNFVGMAMVLVPGIYVVLETVRQHGLRPVLEVLFWMAASVFIMLWMVVAILLMTEVLP